MGPNRWVRVVISTWVICHCSRGICRGLAIQLVASTSSASLSNTLWVAVLYRQIPDLSKTRPMDICTTMQIIRYLLERIKVAMSSTQVARICTISPTQSTTRSTRIWCRTPRKKSPTQCSKVASNPTVILRAGQEVVRQICSTQRTLPPKWFITVEAITFWIAGRISITINWAVRRIKVVIQRPAIRIITIFSSMTSGWTKVDCLTCQSQTICNLTNSRI